MADCFRKECLISYANPDELPPLLREKLKILPFRRNVLYTVARSNGLAPHLLGLIGSCFDGKQRSLPELDWQLIVLRVSTVLDCKYEWDVNLPVAEVYGISPEKLADMGCPTEAVSNGKGPWIERDRVLLRLVDEQLATYTNEEETVKTALELVREDELVEVLIIIGLYAMLARLIKSLKVDDDPKIPGLKEMIGTAITPTK